LDALWENLPNGCQQLGRRLGSDAPGWWCEETACDVDCIDLPDAVMVGLFAHALSDAAKQSTLGCESEMSGSNFLRSQSANLHSLGRIDIVAKVETLQSDINAIDGLMEVQMGGQSCVDVMQSEGASMLIEAGLSNATQIEAVLNRSPDLQQRLCALYIHDFVCLGYDLLPACTASTEQWLDKAIERMLNDVPVTDIDDRPNVH